jgi:glycosyltransferase involved in cell wall biosynthesis
MPGVSVVVPTFRSPGTLARLCDELITHVRPLFGEMEMIIVDDGNLDETWTVVTDLAERHGWVRGVRLLRNYGQHNALLAGLREARQPLILTIDDDLQNPPSEVARLAAALTDDVDLVYGTPIEKPHSLGRSIASNLTKQMMSKLLGPDVHARSSAFRLFRREMLGAATEVRDPFLSIDVILSWATGRVRSVDVNFAPRAEGTSGYNFRKLVRHAFNMITGYSTRPLRFVSVLGFAFALFGFGLLGFVLFRYFVVGSAVQGFTFMAAAISMFSGVQLLSLGVVGEYLARMHFRSMGRPMFTIRDRVGDG